MATPDAVQLLRLRQRMERLFAVRDLPLDVVGASQQWSLAMPADPDAPLDQLAAHQLDTSGILPGQRDDQREDRRENAATVARRSAASGPFVGLGVKF